ncbi:EI24 domain-containing protein [Actinokineospora iranica]|uniref:CysZ protein n=1 Tax=Actinokineospora iranica TaxID=1271860 RepID=A0A1G6ZB57_9PSEU|nr:EI24 domain-containing protein [Actinokineospora iranica]SDD98986.1 CysZ protein [Actinokineospora iranica]
MIKPLRDFGVGFGLLLRGFRLVLGDRGLLARGALPALVTSVVLFAALTTLALTADDLVTWATPFADDWSPTWQNLLRIAVGVSVVVGAVAVSLVLFTALTLIIGGPFYESIAEEVEDKVLGGVPQARQVGWGRAAWIGLRDAVALVLIAVAWAIPLFLAGFIPVAGQTVVPVLAVCVGAWLLAIEMTAIPFVRRGKGIGERRRTLRRNRSMTLGFAIPVYLLCLIPLAALVVFPAAMAGGTLLAHRLIPPETG